MNRYALTVALAALAACAARADIVTLAAPASYTPGTPFTVNVGLTPVSNLGLYNVEVVFRAAGASGSWLTIDPPTASTAGYVFSSADNFLGSSLASGTEFRVTLSDFTLGASGTNVTPGANDRLSALTVRPDPTLTSAIEVSIDRSSLFLDNPDEISLVGDGVLPAVSVSPPTTDPTPVPAPAGVLLAVVGLGVLVARRLRRRTRTADTPVE